jgi:hypothetical protein
MLNQSTDPRCPAEYTSIEAFVEFIEDDERPYTIKEVVELGYWLKATPLALNRITAWRPRGRVTNTPSGRRT